MYKRILLAYDGSVEAGHALREGALLAKTCCARIFLLSVIPRTGGVVMAEGVHGGVLAHQIDSYKEFYNRAIERLREFGFQVDARLVAGEPAPTIGAVAREFGADLVVVGHRSQNLLSRWWSGSNQAYLKDHIACSLLIASNPMSDEEFAIEMHNRICAEAPGDV